MSADWALIESDPGVFTELLGAMGAQGLQVEELWSVDQESLAQLGPVYGIIFLFKWQQEEDPRPVVQDPDPELFFAQQVITNACATQAILSVLFNTSGIDIGPELSKLKEFTAQFPPDMRGLAISNCDAIREAHNSFHRPEPFMPDEDKEDKSGEAFHFISYVPVNGTLYELDGLKPGPIKLCDVGGGDDWLGKIGPIVEERVARYCGKEIRFNLMAVVQDPRIKLRRRIEALAEVPSASMEELAALKDSLAEEENKRRVWRTENIRRRHNYVPLIFNILVAMAEKGALQPLIKKCRGSGAF